MALNKDKAGFGRWRSAARHRAELAALMRRELFMLGLTDSAAEAAHFHNWMANELWNQYQQHLMDLRNQYKGLVDSAPINISNATKGKYYCSEAIELPYEGGFDPDYEFEGLNTLGLSVVRDGEPPRFYIQGTPAEAGDFTVQITYTYPGWMPGQPRLSRDIHVIVNPDPRSLWRNMPTPRDVPFYKPDTDTAYVRVDGADGTAAKDMVAASNRGRSHAQDGRARDDHFRLEYCADNGWYIMAVADGAGSAKFSREGSRIACDTVVDYCKESLVDDTDLVAAIAAYHAACTDADAEVEARRQLGHKIYHILVQAAFNAHKAINEASANCTDTRPKDFATTLMLAICKKFDFGWFVGAFWVGDGAVCVYNKEAQTFSLLGTPDEGEYSGQTRFLTMPEIFRDPTALYQRVRFGIKDDFTALMLMTDGVSDPMFGTDANLNNIERWNLLWERLANGFPADGIPGVDLSDNNERAKDQLLEWLNFWVPGEHDDRTIAILY